MIKTVRKWIDYFHPFHKKIVRDNIFAIAGQSAFFLLLSAVPLMMFIVSVLQGLHIPVDIIERSARAVLNESAAKSVADFLGNMYDSSMGISLITLVVTLWSAAKGIHSINNGLNRVYDTYENRNWFVVRLRAMIYTVVFFIIILATMLIVVLGTTITNWIKPYLSHLPDFVSVLYYFRYVIVFLYLVLLFVLIYRNFPNLSREQRREYRLRTLLPGALFCAASWLLLAFGISIYVDNFNGFSIYGGLTRVAVVMIWLYFCMVCLMLGAEFNFCFHREIDWFTGKLKRKKQKSSS